MFAYRSVFGIIFGLIAVLGVGLFSANALAEKRIALVIGNSNYEQVGLLPNPVNDAKLISTTLSDIGFEVITELNATQKKMKRSIRKFGALLSTAGDDAVGLFFYAGHGVQVGGSNYMIPVDAVIEREGDVNIESIDANSVLAMMEYSGARLNFVILDACRNNPFVRGFRSSTRGLAEMDAPTGSLIAYATSPGDVAADGDGENSPYSKALANSMQIPGVTVERMFREVRNLVRANTNNEQTPWESSSLIGGDFYFNPKSSSTTAQDAVSSQTTQKANAAPMIDKEILFWQSIQGTDDPALYEAYVSQYPNGTFAGLARALIAKFRGNQTPVETNVASLTQEIDEDFDIRPMDEDMIVLKTANIRSRPSTKGDRTGRLNTGSLINVIGLASINDSDWYQVMTSEGDIGFIFGPLLGELIVAPVSDVEQAVVTDNLRSGDVFRDCPECPEMVVVSAGSFLMGSEDNHSDEKPVHVVSIPYNFAVTKTEITRGLYDRFVRDTGHVAGNGCYILSSESSWEIDYSTTWISPGFMQTNEDPVVCVSWEDAEAYAAWVGRQTGQTYRLLSEAEWEYISHSGGDTSFYQGNTITSNQANFDGSSSYNGGPVGVFRGSTLPVGSFTENRFGLHDVQGNVWEWTADCWSDDYISTPTDGQVSVLGDCDKRVIRGGSWASSHDTQRPSYRTKISYDRRDVDVGFRIVRVLGDARTQVANLYPPQSVSAVNSPLFSVGDEIIDCEGCPQMIVLPAGNYEMGSDSGDTDELPIHSVYLDDKLAVGVYEITQTQFAEFVFDTDYDMSGTCSYWNGDEWVDDYELSWIDPGYEQTMEDPVVCVSWEDTNAYIDWLTRKTGETYRMLTEAEWEYAARAGSTQDYSWGDDVGVGNANCNDCGNTYDGEKTVRVGSYYGNEFGLFDMHGNVWEWVEDCYISNYDDASAYGYAAEGSDTCSRVMRGGSYNYQPSSIRSAFRNSFDYDKRSIYFGMRLAREL